VKKGGNQLFSLACEHKPKNRLLLDDDDETWVHKTCHWFISEEKWARWFVVILPVLKLKSKKKNSWENENETKNIVVRLIRLSFVYWQSIHERNVHDGTWRVPFFQQNKKLTFLWTSITERESIIISNCCTIRFFIVFNLRFDFSFFHFI
jgi:hypothetical protein